MGFSDQVNQWILYATIFHIALIVFEIVFSYLHKLGAYHLPETLASMVTGLIHVPYAYQAFLLGFGYKFSLFKFAPGIGQFLIAIILTDFVYYWQHRMNHTAPFFWSLHEAHHSSTELNMVTAIRVSWIMPLFSTFFFVPIAWLGIQPMYIMLSLVILFYVQWWCHSSIFGRIPLLEGWINTAAAHRVHHSRVIEESCGNYGGIFMVWDRLFGTYHPETKKIVEFGIPGGHVGYNPLRINLSGVIRYAQTTIFPRMRKMRDRMDRLHDASNAAEQNI